jgi:hypothetical protein
VYCGNGEAEFWLEPEIELAKNYHLSRIQLKEIEGIIEAHYFGVGLMNRAQASYLNPSNLVEENKLF